MKFFAVKYHGPEIENYLHPVNDRGKVLWIDSFGAPVFRSNQDCRTVWNLFFLRNNKNNVIHIYKGNKTGLVTNEGEILFDTKYHSIDRVGTSTIPYYVVSKKLFGKTYYGLAYNENRWILPLQKNKKFIKISSEPGFKEVDKDKEISLTLGEGLNLVPFTWPSNDTFSKTKDLKCLKTLDGKEVFNADFVMDNGRIPLITFRKDWRSGVANNMGQVVIPNYFSNVSILENNLVSIYQDGKEGLAEYDGRILLPPVYDSIDSVGDYIRVEYNGKYGVYSVIDDKLMLLPLFDYVKVKENESKNNGFVVVGKDGIYNNSGDYINGKFAIYKVKYPEMFITNFVFDEISLYVDGFAAVRQGDKWGFVDEKGQVLGSLKYESVLEFNKGLALVKDSDKVWKYINKRGDYVRVASKK